MKTLYLGTDPSHYETENELVHYPVIKIIPQAFKIPHFTHIVFTSKNAVKVFGEYDFSNKTVIAIGKVTAKYLKDCIVAKEETQEGLITLFKTMEMKNAHVLFPRSSLSRPVLIEYFKKEKIAFETIDLYDTEFQKPEPIPDLNTFDEIVFTSPSTVDAFFKIFSSIPGHIKIISIGPVTELKLTERNAIIF